MVNTLLSAGAEFGGDGRTNHLSVTTAAENGFCGVLQRLLSAGADTNVVNVRGQSPLSLVCFNGHEGAVEVLLRHNAIVVSRCDQGCLPCDVVSMGILERRSLRAFPSTLNAAETSAAARIHDMLRRGGAWGRRGWLVMMRARRLLAASQLVDDSSLGKSSPIEQAAPRHGDETQDDAEEDGRAVVESLSLDDAPPAGTPEGVGDEEKRTTTTTVSTGTLIVSDGGHDEGKKAGAGGGWECAVEWVLQFSDEGGVFRQILGFL